MKNRNNYFSGIIISLLILSVPFIISCSKQNKSNEAAQETPQETADYYVNAGTGNDSNDGLSKDAPFKTITKAVSTAAINKKIKVNPGLYDYANGEIFPITLKEGLTVTGDEANKGNGDAATEIKGNAINDPSCYITIKCANNCSISGFLIEDESYHLSYFGIFSENVSVNIAYNTFSRTLNSANNYGGTIFCGSGDSIVEYNDFNTSSYGVHTDSFSGSLKIHHNNFKPTISLPVNLDNASGTTEISNNTIIGTGQVGIQVQYGNPVILNNTFNNSTGYTYGAIYCESSSPKIRNNIFMCKTAIYCGDKSTGNNSNPDIGTSSNNGYNNFLQVTGPALSKSENNTATDILAIGNTWRNSTPVSGDDILFESGAIGKVWYGTGASDYAAP